MIRVPLPAQDRTGGDVIITSPYGQRTYKGVTRLHAGVDLGTTDGIEIGTPVCAPVDGMIVGMQYNPNPQSEGRNLWFLGDDGTRWKCFHLSKITGTEGVRVSAGVKIAEVGMTGTEAPHLHFEQHVGSWDNPVDCTAEVAEAIAAGRFGLQPQPAKDWFDMASKDDLKAAIREVLAEDDLPQFVAELAWRKALVEVIADATGKNIEWDQGVPKVVS